MIPFLSSNSRISERLGNKSVSFDMGGMFETRTHSDVVTSVLMDSFEELGSSICS